MGSTWSLVPNACLKSGSVEPHEQRVAHLLLAHGIPFRHLECSLLFLLDFGGVPQGVDLLSGFCRIDECERLRRDSVCR
jgi:hypothetical protein